MHTLPLQFSDVIYNAATQRFEALVTVHDHSGARRYACAISAPIDMAFEEAAKGLSIQAMRRHDRKDLGSVLHSNSRTTTQTTYDDGPHYAHAA